MRVVLLGQLGVRSGSKIPGRFTKNDRARNSKIIQCTVGYIPAPAADENWRRLCLYVG